MKQDILHSTKKLVFLIFFTFHEAAFGAYPPFGLAVNNVSVETLSVRWENFDNRVRQFVASISPLNDGENAKATQHVTQSRVKWNGLVPGKTYSVKVASEDIDGFVSQANSINVTTEPASPYDARVSKFVNPILTEYEMNANRTMMYAVYGAVVMWKGPDVGHYDGYKVTVSPPDGMVRLPIELNDGEPMSQIKKKRRIVWDLLPGVYYEFRVTTTSKQRMSEAVTIGERMPPEIPCPIKVDSITPTSVTLSWNHRTHRGLVDGYVIEIDPRDGTEIDPENAMEKGRGFINLTPGTIYNVEVYSTSFGILSFQPRTKVFKTPPHSPVGPIYASNISLTSVTVHWEWPIGKVDYYEVVYWPTNRDHGRLRHRVFSLFVHMTSLQPDTEYSLIIYCVSNGIYSKPLHALVWTKSLNATTTEKMPLHNNVNSQSTIRISNILQQATSSPSVYQKVTSSTGNQHQATISTSYQQQNISPARNQARVTSSAIYLQQTSSTAKNQQTVDFTDNQQTITGRGNHQQQTTSPANYIPSYTISIVGGLQQTTSSDDDQYKTNSNINKQIKPTKHAGSQQKTNTPFTSRSKTTNLAGKQLQVTSSVNNQQPTITHTVEQQHFTVPFRNQHHFTSSVRNIHETAAKDAYDEQQTTTSMGNSQYITSSANNLQKTILTTSRSKHQHPTSSFDNQQRNTSPENTIQKNVITTSASKQQQATTTFGHKKRVKNSMQQTFTVTSSSDQQQPTTGTFIGDFQHNTDITNRLQQTTATKSTNIQQQFSTSFADQQPTTSRLTNLEKIATTTSSSDEQQPTITFGGQQRVVSSINKLRKTSTSTSSNDQQQTTTSVDNQQRVTSSVNNVQETVTTLSSSNKQQPVFAIGDQQPTTSRINNSQQTVTPADQQNQTVTFGNRQPVASSINNLQKILFTTSSSDQQQPTVSYGDQLRIISSVSNLQAVTTPSLSYRQQPTFSNHHRISSRVHKVQKTESITSSSHQQQSISFVGNQQYVSSSVSNLPNTVTPFVDLQQSIATSFGDRQQSTAMGMYYEQSTKPTDGLQQATSHAVEERQVTTSASYQNRSSQQPQSTNSAFDQLQTTGYAGKVGKESSSLSVGAITSRYEKIETTQSSKPKSSTTATADSTSFTHGLTTDPNKKTSTQTLTDDSSKLVTTATSLPKQEIETKTVPPSPTADSTSFTYGLTTDPNKKTNTSAKTITDDSSKLARTITNLSKQGSETKTIPPAPTADSALFTYGLTTDLNKKTKTSTKTITDDSSKFVTATNLPKRESETEAVPPAPTADSASFMNGLTTDLTKKTKTTIETTTNDFSKSVTITNLSKQEYETEAVSSALTTDLASLAYELTTDFTKKTKKSTKMITDDSGKLARTTTNFPQQEIITEAVPPGPTADVASFRYGLTTSLNKKPKTSSQTTTDDSSKLARTTAYLPKRESETEAVPPAPTADLASFTYGSTTDLHKKTKTSTKTTTVDSSKLVTITNLPKQEHETEAVPSAPTPDLALFTYGLTTDLTKNTKTSIKTTTIDSSKLARTTTNFPNRETETKAVPPATTAHSASFKYGLTTNLNIKTSKTSRTTTNDTKKLINDINSSTTTDLMNTANPSVGTVAFSDLPPYLFIADILTPSLTSETASSTVKAQPLDKTESIALNVISNGVLPTETEETPIELVTSPHNIENTHGTLSHAFKKKSSTIPTTSLHKLPAEYEKTDAFSKHISTEQNKLEKEKTLPITSSFPLFKYALSDATYTASTSTSIKPENTVKYESSHKAIVDERVPTKSFHKIPQEVPTTNPFVLPEKMPPTIVVHAKTKSSITETSKLNEVATQATNFAETKTRKPNTTITETKDVKMTHNNISTKRNWSRMKMTTTQPYTKKVRVFQTTTALPLDFTDALTGTTTKKFKPNELIEKINPTSVVPDGKHSKNSITSPQSKQLPMDLSFSSQTESKKHASTIINNREVAKRPSTSFPTSRSNKPFVLLKTYQYTTDRNVVETLTDVASTVISAKAGISTTKNFNPATLDPTKVPLVAVKTEMVPTTKTISDHSISTTSHVVKSTTSIYEERIPTLKPIHIRDGFTAICKPNNFTILVDKNLIGEYEINYGPLYLNDHKDEKCRGIEHPTYYRYTIAPNILDCGTRMELNETHVNFTNTLSNSFNMTKLLRAVADLKSGIVAGNQITRHLTRFLHVRMWCTFPLDLNVSTIFPFLPQLTLQFLNFNVSGVGKFSAVMQLYKTGEYKEAYPAPPKINLTDTLYVGISLLDVENSLTFAMVERCWGTPVRSPNYPRAYPLIDDGCPVKGSLDGTIRIIENGGGKRVKWEGSVFKFIDYDEVWLHCEVKVCLGEPCEKACDESRRRRSTTNDSTDSKFHVISAGPVVLIKTESTLLAQPNQDVETATTTRPFSLLLNQTTILILAIAASVTIIVSCVAVSCIVVRHRRHRSRCDEAPPSITPYPIMSSDTNRSSRFLNPAFKSDDDYLLTSKSWDMRPTELPTTTNSQTNNWTIVGTDQLRDEKMSTFKGYTGIPPYFYETNATLCKDELVRSGAGVERSLSFSLYSAKNPAASAAEDDITG